MRSIFQLLGKFSLFGFLTIITQIGGIAYLISLWWNYRWQWASKWKAWCTFFIVYLVATFVIVPQTAPIGGRERVQHTETIKPTNYFLTVVLNRNYVKPKLNTLLQQTAKNLKGTNIEIRYLDANFPFWDGFPLLPHLSHNDGEKIDLNLMYEISKNKLSNRKKAISGYGIFESPRKSEWNQTLHCKKKGYWQYDFSKYLTFGHINKELNFSEKYTKELIQALLKSKTLGKIFLEPHLKTRLKVTDSRVRFHGCQAVRHDDHIHIQL